MKIKACVHLILLYFRWNCRVDHALRVVAMWSSFDTDVALLCVGIERFKVVRICEERPVLICEVEVLEEDDDSHPEVQCYALAENLTGLGMKHNSSCTASAAHQEMFVEVF